MMHYYGLMGLFLFFLAYNNSWVLEWALSIDNLFVFYVVFNQYRTPHCQRRAALFYGILVSLRLFQ